MTITNMRRAAALVAALAILGLAAGTTLATQPDPEHKVAICHRTASDTNPYVFIEVDEASLDAHLNNLPGHPAKEWKSDGMFRGVAHLEGDLKSDYLAETAADCAELVTEPTPTPTPSPTPTLEPTPTPTPDATPAPPGAGGPPKDDVPNTAMEYGQAGSILTLLGLLLAAFGTGWLAFRIMVQRKLR